jgi:hypothetical protein
MNDKKPGRRDLESMKEHKEAAGIPDDVPMVVAMGDGPFGLDPDERARRFASDEELIEYGYPHILEERERERTAWAKTVESELPDD